MIGMASSRNCSNGSKNVVILVLLLIFSLNFSQSIAVGSNSGSGSRDGHQQKELVIGSRPPRCVNKCLNCSPCVAALVVSQRHKAAIVKARAPKDDGYYLLSWKCKCKDRYFQP